MAIVAGTITACAPLPVQEPEYRQRASGMERSGRAAFNAGDYVAAAHYYDASLRVSRSVEDTDGIASALVNLATVYRAAGKRDMAEDALAELLDAPLLPFRNSDTARAAYLLALIHADAGDADGALRWADAADDVDIAVSGRTGNLRARLALDSGDHAGALTRARAALEHNRTLSDRMEEANSLRLIGIASQAAGRASEAEDSFRAALAIDKAEGHAAKIASDLACLGNLYRDTGRTAGASVYFLRASGVYSGLGDTKAAEDYARAASELQKSPLN